MLISLKAGGTGLNLTAADHVFLCDPWWIPQWKTRPPTEPTASAKDAQSRFYRLIAVDTVEERILDLQEKEAALSAKPP